MSDHVFPLPAPREGDHRFSVGLIFDVIGVLDRHGYPHPASGDLARLLELLAEFLHGDALLEQSGAETRRERPESPVAARSHGPEGEDTGPVDDPVEVERSDWVLDALSRGEEPAEGDLLSRYLRAWKDEIAGGLDEEGPR